MPSPAPAAGAPQDCLPLAPQAPASVSLPAAQPAAAPCLPLVAPSPVPQPKMEQAALEPLSAERFCLRVTLSREARDALLRARALLLRSHATDDLGAVIERALSELCQRLEGKKFGKRNQPPGKPTTQDHAPSAPSTSLRHAPGNAPPSQTTPAQQAPSSPGSLTPASSEPEAPADPRPRSRYIPRPVRRAVAERDQYRCAYVSPDGHRCSETARLEFHHRQPYARGGESTVAGLELRCRLHNDLQARLDYGEAHMAAMKQARKGALGIPPPTT
jgi:hypothetical protein